MIRVMPKELTLREHQQRAAKSKWANMTAAEKTAAGRKAVNARWAKAKKKAVTKKKPR